MKSYTISFALFLYSISLQSQTSFEGAVYFKASYTALDSTATDKAERALKFQQMVGDSIQMLYSNRGDLKFIYLNSSESGMESYLIMSNGLRKRKLKSGNVDNPSGKIRFIGKFKVDNQIVLGLDCECYQYRYKTAKGQSETETFCFNPQLPTVDYRLFHHNQDHFERDFFETAERPYLKHVIETPMYMLEYTAYKIELAKFPENTFK